MIYVFIALQPEAKLLIEKLDLKLDSKCSLKWPIYSDFEKQICLCVTGPGKISSIAAVSSVLTFFSPDASSVLFNIGTCAGPADSHVDKIIANKIVDDTSNRTFYPDILFEIMGDFEEAELHSVDCPVDLVKEGFYDMEAAFIYQAANFFLRPDQMIFLKIVSDSGTANKDMQELKSSVEKAISSNVDSLFNYIASFLDPRCTNCIRLSEIDSLYLDSRKEEIDRKIADLSQDFRCSTTMEKQLRQLFKYGLCLGMDIDSMIEELYKKEMLPVQSKKEGIKVLAYLNESIIK